MNDFNEVIKALGLPDGVDPLAINADDSEVREAALSNRVVEKVGRRSIDFQSLHLVMEIMIMSILEDLYAQDSVFTYNRNDAADTQILISNTFNRVKESPEVRPQIVVGFQSALADTYALRDMTWRAPPDLLALEKKSTYEVMTFGVSVVHLNRDITSFLGGQVRAHLIAWKEVIRQAFNLQKVGNASITGLGLMQEYDDLFAMNIQFQAEAMPQWTQTRDPKRIKKILVEVEGRARGQLQDAIVNMRKVIECPPADQ